MDRPLDPVERHVGIGHQRDIVQGRLARVEESAELLVVAESASGKQRRHGTPEAGERRRLRKRLRQQPFEARDDHPVMVAATGLPGTYRLLIGGRQRAAGFALRASASARVLRFVSHSYQAASSWLALKIDE